ncbi:hypothetical protein [Candidatus Odyssella thessalonicensis]|uniref:hypothetical protein n=1 Tax=Candidatus Odyssella thessalonicensis TaxID=84647 RepID=UPI000225B6ED|nr:hypothetical protein [Candidatus Odyssella thessalonicensis]
MIVRTYILLAIILVSLATSHPQDEAPVSSLTAPKSAAKLIKSIEGVYKFLHGVDSSVRYPPDEDLEDILEIVKVSEQSIYFRTHITSLWSRIGAQWGVASYTSNNTFIYTAPDENQVMNEPRCQFTIKVTEDKIELRDNGGCGLNHLGGGAGSYAYSFDRKRKRKIRYMNQLLNSQQYKQALAEVSLH